ncbi:MAG: translation initiation factor IF-2 N-terminal domain-containing protein, partial [Acidimicrobiales bacterium]
MPKKIRVYELARELGLTNKEALDICIDLGIGVKSHSSSIEDAQADRARRKADREGLRRAVQPEEPAPSPAIASAPRAGGSQRPAGVPAAERPTTAPVTPLPAPESPSPGDEAGSRPAAAQTATVTHEPRPG